MSNLYKKADQSPSKTAAYLKAAISMLESVMQAAEPHSIRAIALRHLLSGMQQQLDNALESQLYEIGTQFSAGLITYEVYANEVARTMAVFNSMYTDIKNAV